VPALLYSWSQDFLKAGGYSALLTRLNELLEVEWRYVCVIIPHRLLLYVSEPLSPGRSNMTISCCTSSFVV
jgi:hypothetical protein